MPRWPLGNTGGWPACLKCVLVCLLALHVTQAAKRASAAAPSISDVSLRGLQIGGTTVITVHGSGLLPEPQLVLPLPVVKQTVREGATAEMVQFEVELDRQAEPGIVPLRVASAEGISNSVAVGVDRLSQLPWSEEVAALPAALHGSLSGEAILTTSFRGRRGMNIVVEVESRRLGANLRPVLRLMDQQGRQIAFSQGIDDLQGDARVAVELPSDGMYQVQLHDLLYRAAQPGFFRLKVGELEYAELAFPLGVERGKTTAVQLLSRGKPAMVVDVIPPADSWGRWLPVLPKSPWFSGIPPRVAVSDHAELIESDDKSVPQPLAGAPIGVSGRLAKAGEEDRYALTVTPGMRLRLELYAQRAGAEFDGVLLVRSEDGTELARGDDQPGTADPRIDFTVPANTNQVILAIHDLQRRGDEHFVYRLAIADLAQPSVGLALETDRVTVPRGGGAAIRVNADRQSYNGPIDLEIAGLPAGVTVTGQHIPQGSNMALLTLSAGEDVQGFAMTAVHGRGLQGETALQAIALGPRLPESATQPWWRDDFPVAVGAPPAVKVQWVNAEQATLPRGGKLDAKLQLAYAPGVTGKVRVRLLTTQPMPRKTIKENNQEKEVDDVERALRLESDLILDAPAAEAVASILVPADLPANPWAAVFVAELLSADGQSVVASSTTACHLLSAVAPLALELSSPAEIQARSGAGETGKLSGKLIRASGVQAPVTLTLTGLPEGYPSPTLVIPADQQQFEFTVKFPYGAAAAELGDVQLVASYEATPQLKLSSNAVPLKIVVVPGERPEAEPPLVIFEDQSEFVQQLSQGSGQASLDTEQHYSGTASVKVTPDQRFQEKLSTLGIKIRENPGPGEYRYLQFAWKKQGGAAICLQLNHDGKWGPGGSGRDGATFRYHAGPAGECFGGSLSVGEALPSDWVVVTRDLFADFGEFTLDGIALAPVDGEFAWFDHLYLGRWEKDFGLVQQGSQ